MREKIQASRENQVINPATIAKIPVTPAIPYLNNITIIYLNKAAIIYLNRIVNLLELKNPRGVRLSHPKTFKRLGRTVKKAINRLIRPRVKGEPQAGVEK